VFVDKYTNGFQPLYVWVMATAFWVAEPESLLETETLDFMVKVALVYCILFDLLSVLLVIHIVRLSLRRRSGFARDGPALFAGLLWAIHPATLRVATNGLETSLAVLFLLLAWRLSLTRSFRTTRARSFLALGLVVGVGGMARIDILVLGVYFGLASLWALVGLLREVGPSAIKAWFLRNLALLTGTLLGYAPWFFYSLYYTGEWFPISGKAVRWISLTNANFNVTPRLYYSKFRVGIKAIRSNSAHLLIIALVFIAVAIAVWLLAKKWRAIRESKLSELLRETPLKWLALPLTQAICIYIAYTCYIFAPWFFKRYLYVVNPLLVCVSGVALALAVQWVGSYLQRRWVRPVLVGITAILVGYAAFASRRFQIMMFWPASIDTGYRNLGIWADAYFPRGTVIGSSQTGALAYYARNIRCVNLDGVVNSEAIREIMAGRNMDYIRSEGIDYVVGWRTNTTYIKRNTKDWSEDQLIELGQVAGFRSWHSTWRVYDVIYPVGHPKRKKQVKLLPPGLGVEASDHFAAAEAEKEAIAKRRRKRAERRRKELKHKRNKAKKVRRPTSPAAAKMSTGTVRIPAAGPIRTPAKTTPKSDKGSGRQSSTSVRPPDPATTILPK